MTDFVILAVWAIIYVIVFAWIVVMKGRVLSGGVALFALSLIPAEYGRWITPSEWHDYPGMMVYYFPTMLAGLMSVIVLLAGLALAISRDFLNLDNSQ